MPVENHRPEVWKPFAFSLSDLLLRRPLQWGTQSYRPIQFATKVFACATVVLGAVDVSINFVASSFLLLKDGYQGVQSLRADGILILFSEHKKTKEIVSEVVRHVLYRIAIDLQERYRFTWRCAKTTLIAIPYSLFKNTRAFVEAIPARSAMCAERLFNTFDPTQSVADAVKDYDAIIHGIRPSAYLYAQGLEQLTLTIHLNTNAAQIDTHLITLNTRFKQLPESLQFSVADSTRLLHRLLTLIQRFPGEHGVFTVWSHIPAGAEISAASELLRHFLQDEGMTSQQRITACNSFIDLACSTMRNNRNAIVQALFNTACAMNALEKDPLFTTWIMELVPTDSRVATMKRDIHYESGDLNVVSNSHKPISDRLESASVSASTLTNLAPTKLRIFASAIDQIQDVKSLGTFLKLLELNVKELRTCTTPHLQKSLLKSFLHLVVRLGTDSPEITALHGMLVRICPTSIMNEKQKIFEEVLQHITRSWPAIDGHHYRCIPPLIKRQLENLLWVSALYICKPLLSGHHILAKWLVLGFRLGTFVPTSDDPALGRLDFIRISYQILGLSNAPSIYSDAIRNALLADQRRLSNAGLSVNPCRVLARLCYTEEFWKAFGKMVLSDDIFLQYKTKSISQICTDIKSSDDDSHRQDRLKWFLEATVALKMRSLLTAEQLAPFIVDVWTHSPEARPFVLTQLQDRFCYDQQAASLKTIPKALLRLSFGGRNEILVPLIKSLLPTANLADFGFTIAFDLLGQINVNDSGLNARELGDCLINKATQLLASISTPDEASSFINSLTNLRQYCEPIEHHIRDRLAHLSTQAEALRSALPTT